MTALWIALAAMALLVAWVLRRQDRLRWVNTQLHARIEHWEQHTEWRIAHVEKGLKNGLPTWPFRVAGQLRALNASRRKHRRELEGIKEHLELEGYGFEGQSRLNNLDRFITQHMDAELWAQSIQPHLEDGDRMTLYKAHDGCIFALPAGAIIHPIAKGAETDEKDSSDRSSDDVSSLIPCPGGSRVLRLDPGNGGEEGEAETDPARRGGKGGST